MLSQRGETRELVGGVHLMTNIYNEESICNGIGMSGPALFFRRSLLTDTRYIKYVLPHICVFMCTLHGYKAVC